MRVEDWLGLFRRYHEQTIFHFNHLRAFTGMDPHTLRVALGRLTQRKILQRICRGYYANPFHPPTLEEISAEIYKPSYISLESALSRHGVLSQIPQVLTCVTSRLPRKAETSFGTIRYQQVKKACLFGFVKEGPCFLAEPEKALVDFLYLNRRGEIQGMVSEFKIDRLNRQRLNSYAKKMGVSLSRMKKASPR